MRSIVPSVAWWPGEEVCSGGTTGEATLLLMCTSLRHSLVSLVPWSSLASWCHSFSHLEILCIFRHLGSHLATSAWVGCLSTGGGVASQHIQLGVQETHLSKSMKFRLEEARLELSPQRKFLPLTLPGYLQPACCRLGFSWSLYSGSSSSSLDKQASSTLARDKAEGLWRQ